MFKVNQSRRDFIFGLTTVSTGLLLAPHATAQKITVSATKRKIELAGDLYVLNERLVSEAGAVKLGYRVDEARGLLQAAFDDVNTHLDLLLNGEADTELEKEYSVAVQFALSDLQSVWDTYGQDVQTLSNKDEITVEDIEGLLEQNDSFGQQVKDLVNMIYEVYGSVIFEVEDLRAITLLAHERRHLEKMKEFLVLAAILPDREKYVSELVKLSDVFVQTIDVLVRNGAMFGVAPAPSAEAQAALERVEAEWTSKGELISYIASNGAVTLEEVDSFFKESESVARELEAVIAAYNAALPRA